MRTTALIVSAALVGLAVLAGLLLWPHTETPPPAGQGEVRVAAAADLKFALDEVVADFRRARPAVTVTVTYGASGNFFAQLSNRAPFDLYLSADVEYPRKLVEMGLADGDSEFLYAVGHLVLWVPNAS